MRARTTAAAAAAVLFACTSATASAAAGPAAAAGAAGSGSACTTWQLVRSPAPGFLTPPSSPSYAEFSSVSVLSSHDVWFVGRNLGAADNNQPWAAHWNGHSVAASREVPLYPGAQSAYVSDPYRGSFDSGTDGWFLADTNQYPTFAPSVAFGYHWHDGQWATVPMAVSPHPDSQGPRFTAIAAVSPDDAWAAGASYSTKAVFGTTAVGALIAHWDGTTWNTVPNPAANRPGAVLHALGVVSPSDIWAVGQQGNPNQITYSGSRPLIEHWDGSAWSVIPAPAAGKPSFLYAVSGDSATDAWAVGYQTKTTLGPLIEHWDGKTWNAVTLPPGLTNLNGLVGVYAAAPDDVWATEGGSEYPFELAGPEHHVFLHWDGTAWSAVPGPGPREYGFGYWYEAIGGTGPGNIWAAGTVTPGDLAFGQFPLIAHLSCRPGGQ